MSKIKLGDITKIRTGRLDANASSENGTYPFFTCSKDPLRINSYSYDCECVLVAGNGDLNVKYYKGKFDAYQRTYIIEDNSSGRLYLPYLYYFLELYVEELRKLSIGGVIKYIKLGNLTDAILELPSMEEQKAIVNILDKSKRMIESKNELLQSYDQLIKSRFVEMFGDLMYSPKYDGVKLKTICNTLSGGTPTTKHPEYYEGNIPWITTVQLGPNYIDGLNPKAFITQEAINKSATHLIPAHNILFGTRVGVGKCSINKDAMCTNQDINAIIDIDTNKWNLLFIKKCLDQYLPYFDSIKKGATILGITSDNLKDVNIPKVEKGIQDKYASFVEQIDKLKFENELLYCVNRFTRIKQTKLVCYKGVTL